MWKWCKRVFYALWIVGAIGGAVTGNMRKHERENKIDYGHVTPHRT